VEKAPNAFRTISEVADELDVPQHVLRFWETRFAHIKPMKRGGGRRYYRPDDVDLLRGIRHLLYGEGYTIRGVQRLLKDNGIKFVQAVWREDAPQPNAPEQGINGVAGADHDVDEAAADPPEEEFETTDDEADATEVAESVARLSPAQSPPPPAERPALRRSLATPQALRAPEPPPAELSAATAEAASRTESAFRGLSVEDLRRLQLALQQLGECRRLLEAARLDDLE
jgi:DNA-binding transcriptional MerR regulator